MAAAEEPSLALASSPKPNTPETVSSNMTQVWKWRKALEERNRRLRMATKRMAYMAAKRLIKVTSGSHLVKTRNSSNNRGTSTNTSEDSSKTHNNIITNNDTNN